jgi:tetratricopeptide (TPR) repeat protein
VRKSGDRVRITAQLIKAADGFHAWSDAFTRDLKDIFAVQDEIAALVAKSLSLKLDLAENPVREVNPAAYRLFLEGRTIFNRGDTREYGLAIDCYRRSLEIDPNSALTWAWLALPHTLSSGLDANSPAEGYRLGREAAARALALDPDLAKAHASMAFVDILGGWDWKQAEAHLERAAEIAPGDVETAEMRAHLLTICGHAERALPLAQRAMEDDPLNYIANYALGRCLFVLGRFDELEAKMEHAVRVNPAGMRMRFYLSVARLFQGKPDAAAQAAEALAPGWVRYTALACARFAQGSLAESEAELGALKAGFASQAAYQVAEVHAFRGETDLAFEWLEKSYETRDSGMPLMKCDPFLATVRSDSRWLPLLERMRLTDDLLA